VSDRKISQLAQLTSATAAPQDLAVLVDVSDTTMAASGTTKQITLSELAEFVKLDGVASFSWDSGSSSPAAVGAAPRVVTNIHLAMRRCVVNDAGVVQYYLSDTDSTKKADGSNADLTGADGQVMVEIPKFYASRIKVGTITTWAISPTPRAGFGLHPAFLKDGVEVSHRYIGAYDACVFDTSAGAYVDGLNLDNADSIYTYTEDVLSSVAGKYPAVGITRAQARQLAGNRGAGWRLVDFWLIQAIQMLYLVEFQTYFSQQVLGAGNTNGSYLASSSVQTDSPHTIAGASNIWGNGSTNATQPSAGAKPGTAYMSYRGIENLFGNAWNWVDGFNILDRQAFVSNTTAHFADATSTNYAQLGAPMPSSDGVPTNHQDIDYAWLPASVGGSTTTHWTDNYFQASGWRVARFGGSADVGAGAGAFCWVLTFGSSGRGRSVSARLAR
jgi:hypothetical protein